MWMSRGAATPSVWSTGDAAAPRLMIFHAQHPRLTPLGYIDAAAPRLGRPADMGDGIAPFPPSNLPAFQPCLIGHASAAANPGTSRDSHAEFAETRSSSSRASTALMVDGRRWQKSEGAPPRFRPMTARSVHRSSFILHRSHRMSTMQGMTRRGDKEKEAVLFGEAVRRAREKKGMNQSQLAGAAGLSAPYLNVLEHGGNPLRSQDGSRDVV